MEIRRVFKLSTCVNKYIFSIGSENCGLLGYYAATSINFLPTVRDNLIFEDAN